MILCELSDRFKTQQELLNGHKKTQNMIFRIPGLTYLKRLEDGDETRRLEHFLKKRALKKTLQKRFAYKAARSRV